MVSFAKKATNIHSDLEKGSGSGSGTGWLRGIKAGKDLRVRFLQDPEEWLEYREHYSRATNFFPCTGDDGQCGGCASDDEQMQRSSQRYISQVLIQHEDGAKDVGQVRALKIPRALANKLVARAERNGKTLLNRDYTLIRSGNGLDTEYDVETEDKAPLDLSRYVHVDVEAILEKSWEENAPKLPPKLTALPTIQEMAQSNVASGAVAAPVEDDDKPPFDAAPAGAVIESGPVAATPVIEEPTEIDEVYLRSLHKDHLVDVLTTHGVSIPDALRAESPSAIVDWVVSEFGA